MASPGRRGRVQVTDRIAEARLAVVAHGQQRDLIIEGDEAFDDDPADTGATALLRVGPRVIDVRGRAHDALTFA